MQVSCSLECVADEKVVPLIFSSNDIFLKRFKSALNPFYFYVSVVYYYKDILSIFTQPTLLFFILGPN